MKMKTEKRFIIENMEESDLKEVAEIEQKSFSDPWSLSMFRSELSNPASHTWIIKDSPGVIVGYICFWIIFDEVHLLNLAVHPGYRRRGIGSLLLTSSIDFWKKTGIRGVYLEVRESNIPAKRLYEKFGFRVIGRRYGYYKRPVEDALVMYKEIIL